MTRAVGNGLIKTLADAIGTGAVGKLAKQVAGLSTDMANIKTPDKGSGLMFNPDTGKLYIPCGNGVTVNKNTGMLEVPIGDNLRYMGSGLDVPDADETTAGVVKLTHEVSNRDDGEWAITADGVYAYAPGYKTPGVDIKNVTELKITGTVARVVFSNGWICFEAYGVAGMEADVPFAEIQGYAADMSLAFIGRDNTQFGDFPLTNNAGKISIALRSPSTVANKTIAVIFPAHKL